MSSATFSRVTLRTSLMNNVGMLRQIDQQRADTIRAIDDLRKTLVVSPEEVGLDPNYHQAGAPANPASTDSPAPVQTGKRHVSAATRKRISAAQKKRYAKAQGNQTGTGQGGEQPRVTTGKGR